MYLTHFICVSCCVVQVISQVPALGEVTVGSLADIQGQAFSKPVVLICDKLGGMEVRRTPFYIYI
jgi:hypothetical protein